MIPVLGEKHPLSHTFMRISIPTWKDPDSRPRKQFCLILSWWSYELHEVPCRDMRKRGWAGAELTEEAASADSHPCYGWWFTKAESLTFPWLSGSFHEEPPNSFRLCGESLLSLVRCVSSSSCASWASWILGTVQLTSGENILLWKKVATLTPPLIHPLGSSLLLYGVFWDLEKTV